MKVTTYATNFDLYWTFPVFYNVARDMTIVRVWVWLDLTVTVLYVYKDVMLNKFKKKTK